MTAQIRAFVINLMGYVLVFMASLEKTVLKVVLDSVQIMEFVIL